MIDPITVISFDPGLGKTEPGGVCFKSVQGNATLVLDVFEMPAAGKIVDVPGLIRRFVENWNAGIRDKLRDPRSPFHPDMVVVEKQHARPSDSHASMNTALPAYGQLIGMCQARHWPLHIVDPKDWKRGPLRGTARDKPAACAYVSTHYPDVDLRPGRRRNAHHGIADAVCINDWAYEALFHITRSNPQQGAS